MRCPELIGRAQQLEQLLDAVRRLGRGEGSAMLILGEAGIGKTRLVNFATAAAERAGARVTVGRAVPELVTSPLRPIAEALMELTRGQSRPDADDTFAPYVSILATLVPHWRGPGWRAPQEPPLVMAEAVLGALERFASDKGLLLVLEDLHWADDATLATVRFLADHLSATSIGVVATARTGDARADVVELLGANPQVIELGRLTAAETEAMVAACLGEAAFDGVNRIVRDSGGLPLLVEDLLVAGAPGGIPQRFADTVRARLGRFNPTERAVLFAAAVLGERFDWHLLPAIANVSQDTVTAALHRAAAFQLVAFDAQGFMFRHGLTRDVVVAEMSFIDRQRCYLSAAQTLRSLPATDEVEHGLMIGRLLVEAGRHEQGAQVLLATGRQALERGLLAAAEPVIEKATTLVDEGQLLGAKARYELARALLLCGRPRAAADTALRAASVAEKYDPALAARLRLLLARAGVATAEWDVAEAHLGRVRRTVDGNQAVAAELAVLEAHLALGTTHPDVVVVAEHAASRAVGIARQSARPDLECEALEVLGLCARMRDLDDAVAALDRALTVARDANLPVQWLHVLNELGSVEMLRDARGDRLEEARAEALRVGALGLATSIGVNLASVKIMTGRFAEGIRDARDAEASAARLGLVPLQAAAHLMQGFAMAHQGNGPEMEHHLRTAESLAPADAELQAGAWAIGRALYALLQENRSEARRALVRARQAAPGEHARILNPYIGPELLLRAVADELGVAEARASAASVVRAARWSELWTYSALAVAEGRAGRDHKARSALATGLEAGQPYPVFVALAQRLVAEAALRDRWCDPEPTLRAAEATFESLGLGRAANACRRLLTTLGRAAPSRRKTDAPLHPALLAAGVTVREAEVMDLLVERLSNREIGARLYLSPRTVEKHIASLLEKLEVERNALAHLAQTLR